MKKLILGVACVGLARGALAQSAAPSGVLSAEVLTGISARSIGPGLVTGRIADVEIDPKDPNIWYVATAFGGLWKTVNRGITFAPIFDDGPSFNLCCIVIDPQVASKPKNRYWSVHKRYCP